VTYKLSEISTDALISTSEANVDTPETFKSSSSVCPSTSIEALMSISDKNVDTPETLRSSNSV